VVRAYNFASAVDDIDMGVTWVVRGTDHIVNTFKQAKIYSLLDADLPQYSHVGLLTHMSGKKYSKRDSDQLDLSNYHPDAVLNFILRLGWSPRQDDKGNNIINRNKAIDLFLNGGKMRAPNCKVDLNKLDWYNKKYNHIKLKV
jgi:glutamyl/glutaminyl-tRNA synthetase